VKVNWFEIEIRNAGNEVAYRAQQATSPILATDGGSFW
jgi:hypothetical protein